MAYTNQYVKTNWQNRPATTTPVSANNLNKADNEIYNLNGAMRTYSAKVDTAETNITNLQNAQGQAFVGFDVNTTTGVITMTRQSGGTVTFDTALEKIPLQYTVNMDTKKIILTLSDGTTAELDMKDFITVYDFVDTDSIYFVEESDGTVKAYISNTYLEAMNQAKQDTIDAKDDAETAAGNAATSADSALTSEGLAQSWAVGGTGKRTDEDTNNAKYWAEQAQSAVTGGDYANKVDFDNSTRTLSILKNTTVLDTCTISGGSDVDIVTSWESTLSDSKVPSEKLVKDSLDGKMDSVTLSAVATSGSYNDLSNKPTIDASLSSTSTNAIQNKAVNSAIDNKASTTYVNNLAGTSSAYSSSTQYAYGDYAIYSNALYMCIASAGCKNVVPTTTTHWKKISLTELNSNLVKFELVKEDYSCNTTYNNWLDTSVSFSDVKSKYDFLYITIFEKFAETPHLLTNTVVYTMYSGLTNSNLCYSGDQNGAFTIGGSLTTIKLRPDFSNSIISGYKIVGVKY